MMMLFVLGLGCKPPAIHDEVLDPAAMHFRTQSPTEPPETMAELAGRAWLVFNKS